MQGIIYIILSILGVVVTIGCLILSIILFKKYSKPQEIIGKPSDVKDGFLPGFISFNKMVAPSILTFFYILSAVYLIGYGAYGIVASVLLCIINGRFLIAIPIVIGIVVGVVLAELFVRVSFEFAIVLFKINGSLETINTYTVGTYSILKNAGSKEKKSAPKVEPPKKTPGQCEKCGTQNSAKAAFCKNCGNRLSAEN